MCAADKPARPAAEERVLPERKQVPRNREGQHEEHNQQTADEAWHHGDQGEEPEPEARELCNPERIKREIDQGPPSHLKGTRDPDSQRKGTILYLKAGEYPAPGPVLRCPEQAGIQPNKVRKRELEQGKHRVEGSSQHS